MQGRIVILNGAPRSGKSSLGHAMQEELPGAWMNIGVDSWLERVTPARFQPGIGLRPGGERPDLEPFVQAGYAALYDTIAAHSRAGLNVVTDVGHHDVYSKPLGILADCARRLAGLDVLFVGVRCPIDEIMRRRAIAEPGREDSYEQAAPGLPVPSPVALWQTAVHDPGIYDLELDTSALSPDDGVAAIRAALDAGPQGTSAFQRLARMG